MYWYYEYLVVSSDKDTAPPPWLYVGCQVDLLHAETGIWYPALVKGMSDWEDEDCEMVLHFVGGYEDERYNLSDGKYFVN